MRRLLEKLSNPGIHTRNRVWEIKFLETSERQGYHENGSTYFRETLLDPFSDTTHERNHNVQLRVRPNQRGSQSQRLRLSTRSRSLPQSLTMKRNIFEWNRKTNKAKLKEQIYIIRRGKNRSIDRTGTFEVVRHSAEVSRDVPRVRGDR